MLQQRLVGLFGHMDEVADHHRHAAEGRLTLVRSHERTLMRRLVASAIGAIGTPDARASRMMPMPARRVTVAGRSAVIVTRDAVLEGGAEFQESR